MTSSDPQDVYNAVVDEIESIWAAGYEPNRVVFPAEIWDDIKPMLDSAGGLGSNLKGVSAVYCEGYEHPEVVVKSEVSVGD